MDSLLLHEILLVDGVFAQIRLNVVKLTQMSSTTTVATDTCIGIVILEIALFQLRHSLVKSYSVFFTLVLE